MTISNFFNPDDGLTVQALIVEDNVEITGYLDVIDSDYFLDDDHAATRAEFTCAAADVSRSVVGKSLKIEGVSYRVNQLKPDGSGLIQLALLSKE